MRSRVFLRQALAGAILAIASVCSAQSVTVVEFYNRAVDAYFITGRAAEQALLDTVADFSRTGMTFQATAAASATASQTSICRFYISTASPYASSHFYGRADTDCPFLLDAKPAGFTWEGYDFATPSPVNGACPAGTVTIKRGFRAAANGKTPNHRYSASEATYQSAITAGFAGEGAVFCVASATPASSAPVTPPASASDCGTFYFPGKRITYTSTASGAAASQSTFTRTYDPTPVTFNGQAATRIVDTPSTGQPSYTMIDDGVTSWRELGGRSTSNNVTQDTYFNPPIVFPKVMSIGQSIAVNRTVVFNPATSTGNGNQTGAIVYTARESVTVPAGSYANACKFTINTTTTYPSIGSTSSTATTTWIAPGVGMVKSEITDTSTVFGISVTSVSNVVATAVQ
jgi:hypothetical protein